MGAVAGIGRRRLLRERRRKRDRARGAGAAKAGARQSGVARKSNQLLSIRTSLVAARDLLFAKKMSSVVGVRPSAALRHRCVPKTEDGDLWATTACKANDRARR